MAHRIDRTALDVILLGGNEWLRIFLPPILVLTVLVSWFTSRFVPLVFIPLSVALVAAVANVLVLIQYHPGLSTLPVSPAIYMAISWLFESTDCFFAVGCFIALLVSTKWLSAETWIGWLLPRAAALGCGLFYWRMVWTAHFHNPYAGG